MGPMQEIDREAGRGEISLEALRGMPYTEACVKEALRLFPPVTAPGAPGAAGHGHLGPPRAQGRRHHGQSPLCLPWHHMG